MRHAGLLYIANVLVHHRTKGITSKSYVHAMEWGFSLWLMAQGTLASMDLTDKPIFKLQACIQHA